MYNLLNFLAVLNIVYPTKSKTKENCNIKKRWSCFFDLKSKTEVNTNKVWYIFPLLYLCRQHCIFLRSWRSIIFYFANQNGHKLLPIPQIIFLLALILLSKILPPYLAIANEIIVFGPANHNIIIPFQHFFD